MDILLKKLNPHESIINENTIILRFLMKRNILIILLEFFVGFIIIFAFFIVGDYSPGSVIYLSFGFALILLSLIYTYHTFLSKAAFFRKVRAYADRHAQRKNEKIEFHITNDYVKYSDFELKQEVKWSFFTHYRYYKGYLILAGGERNFMFIIPEKLMEKEEFKELYNFVKKNLTDKKTSFLNL